MDGGACRVHTAAQAALSSSQLEQGTLAPRANAQLPLNRAVRHTRAQRAGVPTVWVLADYTCETLWGPAISIVSNALADTAKFALAILALANS